MTLAALSPGKNKDKDKIEPQGAKDGKAFLLPSISSNRDAIGVAANIPGRSALFPFVRVKIEKVPRP